MPGRYNTKLMNKSNHTKAKILTLIPIIVFIFTTICMGALTISYLSTGSDATVIAIIVVGTIFLVLTTVPCFVMSILGTVSASKAKAEGITAAQKFFVIGIIEIAIYSLGLICAIIAIVFTIIAASR